MAYCSKCGKQLPDGTLFCGFCGNKQPILPPTPTAPVYVPPVQPAAPAYIPPTQPEIPVYAQQDGDATTLLDEATNPFPGYVPAAPYEMPTPEEAPKRKIWKILLPILGGVLLIGLVVALILIFSKPHVEMLTVDADSVSLWTGEDCRIRYEAYPEDHGDEITWHSSDETVATVQNGRIEAVGDGRCTITVQAENGVSADITVEVTTKICVEEFDVEYSELFILVDEEVAVGWCAYPEDYNEPISWSSSDETVATVSETGVVRGVSDGICTVMLESESGAIQHIYVEVSSVRQEDLLAAGEWYSYGAYLNEEYVYYDGVYLWLEAADGTGYIAMEDEELHFTWAYADYDYECYYYEVIAEDGTECMFVVYYDGEFAGDLDFYLTDDFWIFFE